MVTITLDEAGEAVVGNGSPADDSESGMDRARDGQIPRDEESIEVDPPLQETGEDDGRKSAASDVSGESVVVVASPPPPPPAAAAPAPSEVEVIDVEDEEDVDDPGSVLEQNPGVSSKESEKLFAAFKTECSQNERSYKKVTRSFLKEFLSGHRSRLRREIVDKFLFLVGHVQEGSRADWLKGSEMETFLKDLLKPPPATAINRPVGDSSHGPTAGVLSSPQNRPTSTPVPNYNVTQNIARQAASTLVTEREESRGQLPLKGRNSIALLKSQQTFQQTFQQSFQQSF